MKKIFKAAAIFATCFLSFGNVEAAENPSASEIESELEHWDGAIFPVGELNIAN